MLGLVVLLTGAGAGIDDPGLWTQFGPWGAALAVLAAVIVWLLRDRARLIANQETSKAAIRAEWEQREAAIRAMTDAREARLLADIDERERRERALYDRLLDQGDHIAPVLVETAEALRRATRTIDRLADR